MMPNPIVYLILAASIAQAQTVFPDSLSLKLDSLVTGQRLKLSAKGDTVAECGESAGAPLIRIEELRLDAKTAKPTYSRFRLEGRELADFVYLRRLDDALYFTASPSEAEAVFIPVCLSAGSLAGVYDADNRRDKGKALAQYNSERRREAAARRFRGGAYLTLASTGVGALVGAAYAASNGESGERLQASIYLGGFIGLVVGLLSAFQMDLPED
jgi:hypothetical protein